MLMHERARDSRVTVDSGVESGFPLLKAGQRRALRGLARLFPHRFGELPPLPHIRSSSVSHSPTRSTAPAEVAPSAEVGNAVVEQKQSSEATSIPDQAVEKALEGLVYVLGSYEKDELQVLLAMTGDPMEACFIRKVYQLSRRRRVASERVGKK